MVVFIDFGLCAGDIFKEYLFSIIIEQSVSSPLRIPCQTLSDIEVLPLRDDSLLNLSAVPPFTDGRPAAELLLQLSIGWEVPEYLLC